MSENDRLKTPVSSRQPPTPESALRWLQLEVHPLLMELRKRFNQVLAVYDDHTELTAASRAAANQHPSAAINIDDGTLVGNLAGMETLLAAIAFLDQLNSDKVAVDSTDHAAAGAAYLLDKLANSGNVQFALETAGGLRRVKGTVNIPGGLTLTSAVPLSDTPGGDPGLYLGTEAAAKDHRHPKEDPVVEGAYLYTAYIVGSIWTACETVFGGYIHPWNNGWTETALGSGVWNRDAVGAVTEAGIVAAFFDGVTPTLGMRVFSTYSPSAPWRMFDGIYVVTDLGSESTHGQVTRATDLDESSEFVVQKCVQVTGGNSTPNHLFRYDGPALPTVDTDPLTWTDLGVVTPPAGDLFELLTSMQLTSEGASTEEHEQTLVIDVGDGETAFTETFSTLDNTPGVAEYPAGMTSFRAMAYATAGSSGSETTLTARLYKKPLSGLSTLLVEATSLDITATAATIVEWQKYGATPISMNPTDKFLVIWNATTTSTTPVTVHLIDNNWQRSTRVRTTVQMATEGAPAWNDIVPTGSATFPLSAATLVTGGKLILGPSDRYLVDPSGFDLIQISTPTVSTGQTKEITLIFSAATKLRHAGAADSGFSPLYLHHAGSPMNPLAFNYAYAVATFMWAPSISNWLLTAYHVT